MNFTELQARALLLASFEGYTDVEPAPDWAALVNEAWRQFSFDADVLIETVILISTVGVCDYEVPRAKQILDVTLAGLALTRSDESYERFLDTNWKTTVGSPRRWVKTGMASLAVVPVPDVNAPILVRAHVLGLDMALPTDQPGVVNGVGVPIPAALHEAVALRAATLQMRPFVVQSGSARMDDYEARYQAFVAQSKAPGPIGRRAAA
jgi:hypothetical protein